MEKSEIAVGAILLIILAASIYLFVSSSDNTPFSFSFTPVPSDAYYTYSENMTSYAVGQPILISVIAHQKPGSPLPTCSITGFNFNMCGNPSAYANQPFCQSKTIFNARSIRIMIDGNNLVNTYSYPNPDQIIGYTLSSNLQAVGPVCCWGVPGACSAECMSNPTLRAYVFSSGSNMDGKEMFKLSVTPPALAPGVHTLSISYYAETGFTGVPMCGEARSPESQFAVNGWTHGDQNIKTNVNRDIIFYVQNSSVNTIYVNNTVYLQNTTAINLLQAQLNSINIQLANSQNETVATRLALEAQKAQLESQIRALNATNTQLAIDKAQLQAQINVLNGILAQTQATLAQTQANLVSVRAALASANSSLNTAQSAILGLNQQIAQYNAIIVSTQAELAAARASLLAVTTAYNSASAALNASQQAQQAAQVQLATALSDLQSARDANIQYRTSVDNLAAQLLATQLLTQQQTATITQLRGVALTQEQIANQSIALAALKEAQAQAALSEVYRVMQEKSAADAAFQVQLQATLAQLNSASASLSEKIAAINTFKAQLDSAYSDLQDVQVELGKANTAIAERQAALAKAQSDVAELQKANAELRAQLEGQTSIPIPQGQNDMFPYLIGGAVILILLGAGFYLTRRK